MNSRRRTLIFLWLLHESWKAAGVGHSCTGSIRLVMVDVYILHYWLRAHILWLIELLGNLRLRLLWFAQVWLLLELLLSLRKSIGAALTNCLGARPLLLLSQIRCRLESIELHMDSLCSINCLRLHSLSRLGLLIYTFFVVHECVELLLRLLLVLNILCVRLPLLSSVLQARLLHLSWLENLLILLRLSRGVKRRHLRLLLLPDMHVLVLVLVLWHLRVLWHYCSV